MKKLFCLLLLPLLMVACATTEPAKPSIALPAKFSTRLQQTGLTFSPPPRFSLTPINPANGVQWYDFAMKSDGGHFEIRYAIKPETPNDSQNGDAALLLAIVSNISQAKLSANLPGVRLPPEMCEKLGADAGFITLPVELHSSFAKNYKKCAIHWIYSRGRGSVYIFYLFDDYAQARDLIFNKAVFRSVKFGQRR